MFSNDLKDMNSQINPSDALITKTTLMMKKELHQNTRNRFWLLYRAIPITACVVLVVITAFHVAKHPINNDKLSVNMAVSSETNSEIAEKTFDGCSVDQEQIITKLTPGIHQDKVSLTNGDLSFHELNADQLVLKENLFTSNSIETLSHIQAIDYLGVDPVPSYLPEDLISSAYVDELGYQQEDTASKVYLFAKSPISSQMHISLSNQNSDNHSETQMRTLAITVAKDSVPYADILNAQQDIVPSVIGEHELTVWYSPVPQNSSTQTHIQYQASFSYHNVGFFVQSKNLTQEEFIEILLSIII